MQSKFDIDAIEFQPNDRISFVEFGLIAKMFFIIIE